MSTLFIDDEDEARASVLWANGEPAVEATDGMRRLDVERVTFKWFRLGDGFGEAMVSEVRIEGRCGDRRDRQGRRILTYATVTLHTQHVGDWWEICALPDCKPGPRL